MTAEPAGGHEMVPDRNLVVGDDTTSFDLPEPRVERLPLDGMDTLPRRLPRALAMSLLLTGQRIGAAGPLEFDLVNQGEPPDEPDSEVDAWVRDVAAFAPFRFKAIKHTASDTAHLTVPEARNARFPSLVATPQSRDTEEGVVALRGKRAPRRSGR